MRMYITGTMSSKQDTFLPSRLYFGNGDDEDTDVIAPGCFALDGISIDASTESRRGKYLFHVRWKGVEVETVNGTSECHTIADLMSLLSPTGEKTYKLVNMEASFDSNVDVTITEILIADAKDEVRLDEKDQHLIGNKIEFII